MTQETDTQSFESKQLEKLLETVSLEQVMAQKPSWANAPVNAGCLGLKLIDCEDFGEWCWGVGTELGIGFMFCEKRPGL